MRCLLLAVTISYAASPTPVAAAGPQDTDQVYEATYLRWRAAIDANPTLGVPDWLTTDAGPPAVRSAVADLLAFGPNLVPFLVKEFRKEENRGRLYRLMFLLDRVSGINLFFNSNHENFYEAVPELKEEFLKAWDAGDYANATALLRKVWNEADTAPGRIDPKRITPIRRYGVYAVPFIAESLEKRNSAELFAAFLIITGERDRYAAYIDNSSKSLPTRLEKQAFVKAWASQNVSKVDRLNGLSDKIRALAR
jgi:hypothetical protein